VSGKQKRVQKMLREIDVLEAREGSLLDKNQRDKLTRKQGLKAHPYRLNIVHWNIPTDGTFCTGLSH
jgi:hypothetical protein